MAGRVPNQQSDVLALLWRLENSPHKLATSHCTLCHFSIDDKAASLHMVVPDWLWQVLHHCFPCNDCVKSGRVWNSSYCDSEQAAFGTWFLKIRTLFRAPLNQTFISSRFKLQIGRQKPASARRNRCFTQRQSRWLLWVTSSSWRLYCYRLYRDFI